MKKIGAFVSVFLAIVLFSAPWAEGQSFQGRTSRGIPQAVPETNYQPPRTSRYGELTVQPIQNWKVTLADEGSYYVTTNVIGTPIVATTSITAYADTAGAVGNYFYFRNTESVTGAAPKNVYMDYIKIMVAVIPTTSTSWQWGLVLDNNAARYTSGGTAFIPVAPNGNVNTPSVVQFYAGALTTAVGTSKRTVGRGTFRGVVPTVFDTYVIVFAGTQGGGSMASAAASARTVGIAPPTIIAPGWNLTLAMWGAACNAAPQFDFEIGHWER